MCCNCRRLLQHVADCCNMSRSRACTRIFCQSIVCADDLSRKKCDAFRQPEPVSTVETLDNRLPNWTPCCNIRQHVAKFDTMLRRNPAVRACPNRLGNSCTRVRTHVRRVQRMFDTPDCAATCSMPTRKPSKQLVGGIPCRVGYHAEVGIP